MLLLGVSGFQEGITPRLQGCSLSQGKHSKKKKKTHFPDNRESLIEVMKTSKVL